MVLSANSKKVDHYIIYSCVSNASDLYLDRVLSSVVGGAAGVVTGNSG